MKFIFKKILIMIVLILSLVFINGCKSNSLYKIYEDISYGNHYKNILDISIPKEAIEKNESRRVILTIHGGSWTGGSKDGMKYITKAITSLGYIQENMNYRLIRQEANYLDMLDDIDKVLNFIIENKDEYYINPDKIAFIGNSAGSHLAMLYAYKMDSPIDIAFVVSQVGPADFSDPSYYDEGNDIWTDLTLDYRLGLINSLTNTNYTKEDLDNKLPFPSAWNDASPIFHVDEKSPPTILAYGRVDNLVPESNANKLADKLKENNVTHSLFIFENSGHGLNNTLDRETSRSFNKEMQNYLEIYMEE